MSLAHPERFFEMMRGGLLGPSLSQTEVDGCNAILKACEGWPIAWTAYALATAYHETAMTMQPIHEHGSQAYFFRMYDPEGLRPQVAARLGNTQPGDGQRFAGRGYVQLTGRANYLKAGHALNMGTQLVEHPDMALSAGLAAQILRRGMAGGWFTGRKLADFIATNREGTRAEFTAARRIINGQDRADAIAEFALHFQDALAMGAWGVPFPAQIQT